MIGLGCIMPDFYDLVKMLRCSLIFYTPVRP
jgi:hypothetical protein